MLIKGSKHNDARGTLCYNNDFDSSKVKRIYTIENSSIDAVRGWQGHKIEQRWFAAVFGSFEISVIKVDNWDNPSKHLPMDKFILCTEALDFLHIPPGSITAIRALERDSKLLVLADHSLGEIRDEYRFSIDYFN